MNRKATDTDTKGKLKLGPGDWVHTIARAGLSAIPVVGGPAAEIFSAVIVPPLSKRRDKWLESIAEGLKTLEKKVDNFNIEDLSQNEVFITIVMHASQAAVRNHQKEKIEALRNAVLNAALSNVPEEDIQLMFLNFIDTFTPWHLRILKFLENPREYGKKRGIEYPHWFIGSTATVLEYTFPELKESEERVDFYSHIVKDLYVRGLVNTDSLTGMESAQGMFEPRITGMGRQFITFITSPIEIDDVEQE